MASINKLPSGKWRVQVRIKRHYLSDSFSLRKDAEMWARRIEREVDLGQKPAPKHRDGIETFCDLIDLHMADMKEVGKEIGRADAGILGSVHKAAAGFSGDHFFSGYDGEPEGRALVHPMPARPADPCLGRIGRA